jgi:hypothetical protein
MRLPTFSVRFVSPVVKPGARRPGGETVFAKVSELIFEALRSQVEQKDG